MSMPIFSLKLLHFRFSFVTECFLFSFLIPMAFFCIFYPTDLSRPEASILISGTKLILILNKKHSKLWSTSEVFFLIFRKRQLTSDRAVRETEFAL